MIDQFHLFTQEHSLSFALSMIAYIAATGSLLVFMADQKLQDRSPHPVGLPTKQAAFLLFGILLIPALPTLFKVADLLLIYLFASRFMFREAQRLGLHNSRVSTYAYFAAKALIVPLVIVLAWGLVASIGGA